MTLGEKIFVAIFVTSVITVLALLPTDPKSQEFLQAPSPVDWENVADDPSEKLTLEWQGIISNAQGEEGSWIETNLEERFNVDFKPLFLDVNAYDKRRPMKMVGGDVPDVMWSGAPVAVRANLRNGFIMELPYEVILEHAPSYVKLVNKWGREAWLYTQFEGRNYGLPTVDAGANRPRISSWRLDWLRNVGIETVPETLEEMYEALYRFRHNDPDGNGRKDTYGWTPNVSHWSLLFAEIFAANGVLAFDLMERDGEVVWGGLLPETKETLRVLQKWYREGLLDPDFPIDSQGRQVEAKFTSGRTGYLYPVDYPTAYVKEEPNSLQGKTASFTPGAELIPGPPLRTPGGERMGRTWGGAAHIIQFGRHLEQEPEKVIRVLRMMEEISKDQTLYMEAQRGKRGLHWEYMPEPYTDGYGRKKTAGIQLVPPYDNEERNRQNAKELIGGKTSFFFPSTFEQLYEIDFMSVSDREWLETHKKTEWGRMNVLGKSDVVPSSGRFLKDLINYQMTVFIEMVIGDRDIEEFDSFVSEWRRRGGDTFLQEANEMYAEMNSIFTKVGAVEDTP